MSGSVNLVILVGRVGKDPELKTLSSGKKVANFSMATSESWKDKSTGEKKERTEWHSVVVWNENLVTIVENYVSKGSLIYIEGELSTRKWEDKNGETRYKTEVLMQPFRSKLTLLGNKSSSDDSKPVAAAPKPSRAAELDDEIPFSVGAA